MGRLIDISGKRFGKLVVLEREPRLKSDKHTKWRCVCDCGQQTVATYINLKTENTTSCGCNRKPHGMTGSLTWRSWSSMMRRCVWKSDSKYNGFVKVDYHYYDYINFVADLGERPSPQHTIDRIDNSRGYEVGNLRWATTYEQSRNKRSNRWVSHKGQTMILSDWARHYGVTHPAIRSYVNKHGSLDGYREIKRRGG